MKSISTLTILIVSSFCLKAQNTNLGSGAGNAGVNNTSIGARAGDIVTGTSNSFLGYESGKNVTSGSLNVMVGIHSGYSTTIGSSNSFFGAYSGQYNTTGEQNVFLGHYSGWSNSTGGSNVFVGSTSGRFNTTGRYNVFVGTNSGGSNTSGEQNTTMGHWSGVALSTGYENTFFGSYSGRSNLTGIQNTFLGTNSGYNNLGSGNVFMGNMSGYSETGSNKLYIDNSSTSTPLIYGDFNTNQVGINALPGTYTFNVGGTINASGIFVNGQSLSSADSWTVAGTNVYSTDGRAIGIGTTLANNPKGYKLAVKGKLGAQEIEIENTSMTWSDFVFDDDYKLMSLSELDLFIQKNNHLPDIPTQEEVRENGIILSEINAKLLQKIEELTLYMIELKKEVEELKKLNR